MSSIVLYITALLCHRIILTRVIQTCRQANMFSRFKYILIDSMLVNFIDSEVSQTEDIIDSDIYYLIGSE